MKGSGVGRVVRAIESAHSASYDFGRMGVTKRLTKNEEWRKRLKAAGCREKQTER